MGGGRPAPGRGGRGGGRTGNLYGAAAAGRGGGMNQIDKAALEAEACKLEEELGYENFTEGEDRLGWLMNICSSSVEDKEAMRQLACANCYFMCQDGSTFKAQVKYQPYMYIRVKDNTEAEVEAYLRRKYEGRIANAVVVDKEDLDLKNHLTGLKRPYLKVSFYNTQDMLDVRRDVLPLARRNADRDAAASAYDGMHAGAAAARGTVRLEDYLDHIVELREYDVPYLTRYCIDTEVRCGLWFDVKAVGGNIELTRRKDLLTFAEVRICAFDIETSKEPLQFPNADQGDQVIMISYMLDKQGYLITNREFVSEDIDDFEYTPKPEFQGPFIVWNEPNEKALLRRWFDHMRAARPGVYVTYNGDFFDWPFIAKRSKVHGMSIYKELGMKWDEKANEVRSRFSLHLDAFCWVNRDSYLPQGSRGLKMVTKYKLGYDPLEVDPEDMVRLCWEEPQKMASYSVSDAVCTYYLYMKYVHPFIFSLATIIPLSPDDVLRKGSGTLCEMLLMVEAYRVNVVCPNKYESVKEKMHNAKLLESETYIGGHVEALQAGIFRSDLPCQFRLKREMFDTLIADLDSHLEHAIVREGGMDISQVTNLHEVKAEILALLEDLRDKPVRQEKPLIYHLDVAAMYPNIILTNRLQPSAIVGEEDCQACDFNKPGKNCLRKMDWVWRGETFAATRSEYIQLKRQMESEVFPAEVEGGPPRYFRQLSELEQGNMLTARLKKYCQRVYKRVLDKPIQDKREAGICMRENSFYIDTVRSFRDRRYEYKGLNKKWGAKLREATASKNPILIQEAADYCVLYDSLQLAHKCILNSFYGYVMRKGARWYSMEMAGVVTHTGAKIIQHATRLVEAVGKPLELDTDGIWCCLPSSFPDTYNIKSTQPGKAKYEVNYPCVVLNKIVVDHFTNEQMQTLTDPTTHTYETSAECSIEFEVDGPYKAMILPASKEAGKLIKKRYAVFNDDGSLAELKGFEIKRRGELKLIKVFQSEVFSTFLEGDTLETAYGAVGGIANRWLDMLDNRGCDLADSELMELIGESTTLSKSLEECGDRKSNAITCATRLGQFLGAESIRDKVGLACHFIVSKRPIGAPTSQRAIPVNIFSAEPAVARSFLRQWTKDTLPGDTNAMPDVRDLVDWDYYTTRLGSAIQKIITIPAALQNVLNPVPRVVHPDWLGKVVRERNDTRKQFTMADMFQRHRAANTAAGVDNRDYDENRATADVDMEDLGASAPAGAAARRGVQQATLVARTTRVVRDDDDDDDDDDAGGAPPAHEAIMPDKALDYRGWLACMKRKWKAERLRRTRQRTDGGAVERGGGPMRLQAGQTLGAFFRRQEAAVTHSYWQVIQMAQTATPGLFKMWMLVDGSLYSVPITVPRRFYINLAQPDVEADCGRGIRKRVNLTLPHSHPTLNLYEVDVSEQEMVAGSQEMQEQMSHPDVEGVYESKVPLLFQALLSIGCVVQVAKHARDRPLAEGFCTDELEFKSTMECAYVEPPADGIPALQHVSVYHSRSADAMRGVYAIMLPALHKCVTLVVSPFANREVAAPVLQRWYHDALPAGEPGVTFELHYVTSDVDAHKRIHKELEAYAQQHRNPIVALVESPVDVSELTAKVPFLQGVPCVAVAGNLFDGQYAALGWQGPALRVAAERTAALGTWLDERVRLARYTHMPLGNLGSDWTLHIADVFFARALRDAKMLLWASSTGEHDLGGMQLREAVSALFCEESHQPRAVCNPGAYRRVCVSLRVHHLAVNALVAAATMSEMEGGNLNDDPGEHVEGAAAALPAFRVLRAMVLSWLSEANDRHNVFADTLLMQLFRWLCSPQSALQDPMLRQLVTTCMHKVFRLLLAELRKLGCTIVYADFNQILLCTGKHSVESAQGYVESLRATIRSRDLFKWIEMSPEQTWHSLLYRDPYNHGGIVGCSSDDDDQTTADGENPMRTGGAATKIFSCWNMAEYLPPAVQEYFELVVSEFVYLPWKDTQRLLGATVAVPRSRHTLDGDSDSDVEPREPPALTPAALLNAQELVKAERVFLEEQLESYFTEKMLRVVRDMERHMGTGAADVSDPAHTFPRRCGSHLTEAELGPPALAFVRAVLEVLLLDKEMELPVALLRRNLLRLLHVGEFCAAAAFRDPCVSYVLKDVICTYCNDCRDLDLCRDVALQERQWQCAMPTCQQPYDIAAIEHTLVQVVRQRAHTFQLQDLACVKCKQVKRGHAAAQCQCAGAFRVSDAPTTARHGLRVFHNIADWHGFEMLGETVDWLLQTSG